MKALVTTGPERSAHMDHAPLPFTERPDQTPGPALALRRFRALLVVVVTAVITSLGFSVISLSPALGQGSREEQLPRPHPR